MPKQGPTRVHYWFEDKPAASFLCIEFFGGFEVNPRWYKPMWDRIRMELRCKKPESTAGWHRRDGGYRDNVWVINMNSEALERPLTKAAAIKAIEGVVSMYQREPFNLDIVVEAK